MTICMQRSPQIATSSKNANQSSASSASAVEANTAAAVRAAAALTTVVPQSVVAPKTAELNLTLDITQRRILDEEDDLSEVQPDAVPTEVSFLLKLFQKLLSNCPLNK